MGQSYCKVGRLQGEWTSYCLISAHLRSIMPAKDRHHDAVVRALKKDGWIITKEQVRLTYGDRYMWIDLRAEKQANQRVILIEVKELDDVNSPIDALASALGKYLLYRMGLKAAGADLPLYMAVTEAAYNGILSSDVGVQTINEFDIALLVFDPVQEVIIRWIT
jgi:XisH protein